MEKLLKGLDYKHTFKHLTKARLNYPKLHFLYRIISMR